MERGGKVKKPENADNTLITSGKKLIPLQRFGNAKDIANVALFLGSDASTYMSGTNIVVDGGSYLTCPN